LPIGGVLDGKVYQMNDSGFWIFVKMTGLTEVEGLKSWTPLLTIVGFTQFVTSLCAKFCSGPLVRL